MRYERNRLERLLVSRAADGFKAEVIERAPERATAHATATIDSSLFLAAQKAGLSDNLTMELAGIFGWDIDFALDIRRGDRFTVIYEELFLDGEKIGNGDILAAEFVNQGHVYRAVRYTDASGRTSYYAPDGHSMRKAFLRTPVAFSRISSRFSLGRKHPILNRIRAHKGVDYAAPYGTPIKATGDGKVIFIGRKGGYGKAVILRHGSRYTTLYAHMSRFARGLHSGSRVRQGQVIGYVGKSGLATGPHLHYEFRINGVHRNPLTVKLPAAAPIDRRYRADFEQKSRTLLAQLDLVRQSPTQVALNAD
ncbi:MAG TPA: M23 family peptidase [Thiotrichales bacterium]|nr:M23 family peptidase [Thiotrichales bacterium]